MSKDNHTGRPRRLRLRMGAIRLDIVCDRAEAPAQTEWVKMGVEVWHPFSPTELRVIRLLLPRAAMSREQIAHALEESADGRLKAVLATLAARHVLRVTTDGYLLNAPDGAIPDIRRWLDELEPAEVRSELTHNGHGTNGRIHS